MKKSIVITTIFPPTQAVNNYSEFEDFKTIIVADKKSPVVYNNDKVKYLSVPAQEKLGYTIFNKLPYNHYSRKNIGYVYAIKSGAEMIIDTDDDNIPYDNWQFPDFNGRYEIIEKNQGFVNIYNLFTDKKIWPRGFPLGLINTKNQYNINQHFKLDECKIGVWQGLSDQDPDVDAIYRLISGEDCFFEKREPLVLDEGTICPFNSQNTAFTKTMFSLLYLPSTVEFRFTDILRGLVAQPIMWLTDHKLGFTKPTVFQQRNIHNYIKDFQSEIPMYLTAHKIVDIVSKKLASHNSITDNLYLAYEALCKENIVKKEELCIVKSWIDDISE